MLRLPRFRSWARADAIDELLCKFTMDDDPVPPLRDIPMPPPDVVVGIVRSACPKGPVHRPAFLEIAEKLAASNTGHEQCDYLGCVMVALICCLHCEARTDPETTEGADTQVDENVTSIGSMILCGYLSEARAVANAMQPHISYDVLCHVTEGCMCHFERDACDGAFTAIRAALGGNRKATSAFECLVSFLSRERTCLQGTEQWYGPTEKLGCSRELSRQCHEDTVQPAPAAPEVPIDDYVLQEEESVTGPPRRARAELADDAAMDTVTPGDLVSDFQEISVNDPIPGKRSPTKALSVQKRTDRGVRKKTPVQQRKKSPRAARSSRRQKKVPGAASLGTKEVHERIVCIPAEVVDERISRCKVTSRSTSIYQFLGFYSFFMRAKDAEADDRSLAKDVDYLAQLLPRVVSRVGSIEELGKHILNVHGWPDSTEEISEAKSWHDDLDVMVVKLKQFETKVLIRPKVVDEELYSLFREYMSK